MADKKGAVREPPNQVHQSMILTETVRKELDNQKLYTNFTINPFRPSKLRGLNWGQYVGLYLINAKYGVD